MESGESGTQRDRIPFIHDPLLTDFDVQFF